MDSVVFSEQWLHVTSVLLISQAKRSKMFECVMKEYVLNAKSMSHVLNINRVLWHGCISYIKLWKVRQYLIAPKLAPAT